MAAVGALALPFADEPVLLIYSGFFSWADCPEGVLFSISLGSVLSVYPLPWLVTRIDVRAPLPCVRPLCSASPFWSVEVPLDSWLVLLLKNDLCLLSLLLDSA